ncbi:MAG TPA: thiamine pyrophosphate-binding protein [Pirellulales bacterium]|nr:thiamine pyrophosphate-binding protein [Pirellulales bacterium]
MLTGPQIAAMLAELGVTHVVWLPDSMLGGWETALSQSPELKLVRVCREGEAWTLAAGLHLGGRRPLVVIQNTGLFESGDALRNVLFDMRLPLYAIVGYRSYLVENSPDTARRFTEPVLKAWGVDHVLIERAEQAPQLAEHYRTCRSAGRPGVALLAEGRG